MSGQPQVLTSPDEVEAHLSEWRALTARAARSPLEAADWLWPLGRRYLASQQTRVLTWRSEDDRLSAILPLSLLAQGSGPRPLRQLAPWGTLGPRMRGLVDLVAEPETREETLDGLCAWLRGEREWDVLRLLRPQAGSTTPARLRTEAGQAGWTYAPYRTVRSTTYQLDLPAEGDGWAKHLSSKTRKVMRWEVRKFEGFRGGRLDAAMAQDELPEALDALQRLLHERWGENETYFSADPQFRELVHEAVPAMARQGAAWLTVARDETGIQGVLASLAQNGYAMALAVAMTTNNEYNRFSLGKHLFDLGIGEAVARGCHTYDFLWIGGYKEDFWHAQGRELESAMVGRGLLGRAAALLSARREGGGLIRRR
ncbi:MAG TPA: GNAT family N-acetyltransferase [Candidatus Limnocylindria bacterium]|nr:GNAT family N-acetyltransferase [Candidatus Limnocylindria bacterium]